MEQNSVSKEIFIKSKAFKKSTMLSSLSKQENFKPIVELEGELEGPEIEVAQLEAGTKAHKRCGTNSSAGDNVSKASKEYKRSSTKKRIKASISIDKEKRNILMSKFLSKKVSIVVPGSNKCLVGGQPSTSTNRSQTHVDKNFSKFDTRDSVSSIRKKVHISNVFMRANNKEFTKGELRNNRRSSKFVQNLITCNENKKKSAYDKFIHEISKPKLDTGVKNLFFTEQRNVKEIINYLMKLSGFLKFIKYYGIDEESIKELCQYITYESVSLGTVIYKQGSESTAFYGIIEGKVLLSEINYLKNNFSSGSENKTSGNINSIVKFISNKIVRILSKQAIELSDTTKKEKEVLLEGALFGEMSLMHYSPRPDTATAMENTKLFVVDKSTFNRIIQKCLIRSEQDKKVKLFEYFLPFQLIQKKKYDEIYKRVVVKYCNKGEVLYMEGCPAENIYVLYQGECELLKLKDKIKIEESAEKQVENVVVRCEGAKEQEATSPENELLGSTKVKSKESTVKVGNLKLRELYLKDSNRDIEYIKNLRLIKYLKSGVAGFEAIGNILRRVEVYDTSLISVDDYTIAIIISKDILKELLMESRHFFISFYEKQLNLVNELYEKCVLSKNLLKIMFNEKINFLRTKKHEAPELLLHNQKDKQTKTHSSLHHQTQANLRPDINSDSCFSSLEASRIKKYYNTDLNDFSCSTITNLNTITNSSSHLLHINPKNSKSVTKQYIKFNTKDKHQINSKDTKSENKELSELLAESELSKAGSITFYSIKMKKKVLPKLSKSNSPIKSFNKNYTTINLELHRLFSNDRNSIGKDTSRNHSIAKAKLSNEEIKSLSNNNQETNDDNPKVSISCLTGDEKQKDPDSAKFQASNYMINNKKYLDKFRNSYFFNKIISLKDKSAPLCRDKISCEQIDDESEEPKPSIKVIEAYNSLKTHGNDKYKNLITGYKRGDVIQSINQWSDYKNNRSQNEAPSLKSGKTNCDWNCKFKSSVYSLSTGSIKMPLVSQLLALK